MHAHMESVACVVHGNARVEEKRHGAGERATGWVGWAGLAGFAGLGWLAEC